MQASRFLCGGHRKVLAPLYNQQSPSCSASYSRYFSGPSGHPFSDAKFSRGRTDHLFSCKDQARDLPLYDHEKLGLCFTNLDETLRELLETVVPSNFVSLPLKPLKPSIFSTNIEDDRYLSGTKLDLAVTSPINAADVIKKAPQLIKLCSAAQIEQLVRMALPGIQLSYAAKPPAPLPVKLNYQYFSLNQAGAAWESVARGRSLAAFVPGDIPEPELELLILLPQAM